MISPKLRHDLAHYARRMHASGWIANHDGNISARAGHERILITPTAISKADTDEAGLVLIDLSGQVLEGTRKPPSELDLHLAVYRARPETQAVVHAHPPTATAFGVAGVEMGTPVMPEVAVSLGFVPSAPLTMPKSPESAAAVARLAAEYDAMLLCGNGAITLGDSLERAYLRMELVEHYAKILLAARALGGAHPLSREHVAFLLEARRKVGLGPKGA